MEIDRSQGYQESKKVRKLNNNKNNLKNNRKFIGNVKIVIQGSFKTEEISVISPVLWWYWLWWQLNNRREKLRVRDFRIQS